MTLDASLIEDWCNVFGISHITMRLDVFLSTDDTTHGWRLRHDGIDPIEKILNRNLKIIRCRSLSNHSDAILIIDPTLIPNPSLLIEHKNFRSPPCSKHISQNLLIVQQHRKANASLIGVGSNLRQAVLNVGTNADNPDTTRFKLLRQLLQSGTVQFCQRTFGAQKRDNEEPGIFKFPRGSRLAVAVLDRHGIEFFLRLVRREAGCRKQESEHQ